MTVEIRITGIDPDDIEREGAGAFPERDDAAVLTNMIGDVITEDFTYLDAESVEMLLK
jgi:hypothetical protein